MKRAAAVLLVLGALALVLILLPRGEDDTPTGTVHREPEVPAPLPGYREEATPPDGDAKPEARLRGRPPTGEARHLLVEVVDPDGEPVPQALLIVERGAGEDWREWVESVAAGRVHVAGPRGAETMNLEVTDVRDAEGAPLALLPRRVEGIEAGQVQVAIVLPWSRRLSGTVMDTDGNAVAGVGVRAGPPARFSAGREATTDEEGRFEIVGLPPGPLEARLRKNDHCVGPPTLAIGPNQHHVDVEVDPLVSFTFEVVDPGGKPLPGVRLHVKWVAQKIPQAHVAKTNQDGLVVLPALPRSATLYAYTEWWDGAPEFPDAEAMQLAAADGAYTLHMPEPVEVDGIVTDPDGNPVEEGWVLLTFLPTPGEPALRTPSDMRRPLRRGRFHFERLVRGRYRLYAGARGYPPRAVTPVEVYAPAREIRIELPPCVVLRGRILGPSPSDVVVQWFAERLPPRLASVHDDGTFTVECVAGVRGALYAFRTTDFAACVVEHVGPADGPFEIECVEAYRITGRVPDYHDRTWRPILSVVRGPLRLRARLQTDGSFLALAVPPGDWMLEWSHRGARMNSIEVQAGNEDVVFPLPPEELMDR